MTRLDVITFLSDFGWEGGYVAACEGVVTKVNPYARISHLSHDISVGDISGGSLILARVCTLFPPAVHLAVVDPGVGTGRRPLAIITGRGDILVGPDNGLLDRAAGTLEGVSGVWALDPQKVRAQAGLSADPLSSTFHGRDVFAPAAALLSTGVDPSTCGLRVDSSSVVRLAPAHWDVFNDGAAAEVIEIDRFGNVGLALPFDRFLPEAAVLNVEIEGEGLSEWTARVVQTFGDLQPGELGILRDSWGQVALALNGASAAELLTVQRGMIVRLARSDRCR